MSCIYKINNKITNDFYIGSTINFDKRKSTHLYMLKLNKHHSIVLQRAYNKYGIDAFEFIVLEKTDAINILEREQYFLNLLKPIYNISKDSTAPMTNRKHTQESKTKMSKKHKGNTYNKGKKVKLEFRLKRSEKRKQFKWNDSVKRKMSETAKRINSISRIDRTKQKKQIVDNEGNIFESLAVAAKFWRISVATVCDILKGRHSKTRKGIIFKYYENT